MQAFEVKAAPWWEPRLHIIGLEKMPLVLIDNFFPEPDILIEDASTRNFISNSPYFPGIRSPLPKAYFKHLMPALSQVMANIFQYKSGTELQEAHYSLTTTAPEQLHMVQRLPHIDGGNDMKLALLHYLCGAEHGGTSFYKQRRTGFETVSNLRFEAYKSAVKQDHETYNPPVAEYYNEPDERFDKIHFVEAKFNRAIIYFGLNLHAVNIGQKALTTDPITGRLTANSFFNPI